MSSISRRSFLQAGAALSAAPLLNAAVTESLPLLQTFDYAQIRLLDGPLRRQFDNNHRFFLDLNEDRLLKIYRQRVGLPAPGPEMGGWYDDFCPGASFGQYVSALARFSRATDSNRTRAKVHRLVQGFAATLDPSGKVFEDLRYPTYTYDKMVIALIDAHSLASDPTALDVLARTTRAAVPHMPDHALTPEEMQARPRKDETYTWDESYTLAENLFLASDRTGDRTYFDMGKRYLLDRTFFDPLSEGQDVLPGLHAYSHVNALSSGMQGYLKLGDPKYLRAVTNAVDLILRDQSYATGGWGPNEAFVKPGEGALGRSLSTTHRSFETPCGGYAHFKVMRYLLAVTRNPRYADSMERVLYNALLGVKPILDDGSTFYYSDYHHSGFKTYKREIPESKWSWDQDDKWPCCSGTFPQVTADYGISSYLKSPDGVYVILYIPSHLTWTRGNRRFGILQETSYPTDGQIHMTVTAPSPELFTVYLRIPAWAGKGTTISVNGRRIRDAALPGTFHPLRRSWKNGDRVEMEIDQTLRYEAVDPQTPEQVAVLRGPQVLFATGSLQVTLPPVTALLTSFKAAPDGGWLWPSGETGLTFRTFREIDREPYQTYSKQIPSRPNA